MKRKDAALNGIKYLKPGRRGKPNKKSTYRLESSVDEAIKLTAQDIKNHHGYNHYGLGNVIESWAYNDPNTAAHLNNLVRMMKKMNTSVNTSMNRAGITLESVSDGLADITTLYCAEVAKIENIGDHISISLEGVDLDQFVSELTPQQKSYVLDAIGAADIAAWWDENEESKDDE